MAEADFTIRMEAITKVNGKIIKWMVLVNFTTKEENLHTKANGLKMSLMVWVKCTTITL